MNCKDMEDCIQQLNNESNIKEISEPFDVDNIYTNDATLSACVSHNDVKEEIDEIDGNTKTGSTDYNGLNNIKEEINESFDENNIDTNDAALPACVSHNDVKEEIDEIDGNRKTGSTDFYGLDNIKEEIKESFAEDNNETNAAALSVRIYHNDVKSELEDIYDNTQYIPINDSKVSVVKQDLNSANNKNDIATNGVALPDRIYHNDVKTELEDICGNTQYFPITDNKVSDVKVGLNNAYDEDNVATIELNNTNDEDNVTTIELNNGNDIGQKIDSSEQNTKHKRGITSENVETADDERIISIFNEHSYCCEYDKPFKCTQCDKCFSKQSTLQEHMRSHIGGNSFKCEHCEKCFKTAQHLKTHVKLHKGDKPNKCENCAKYFSRYGILNLKRLRIHIREKPFICEYCFECFKTLRYLKVHIRVHTGEKPFKCKKCEILKRHLKIQTGEKPFKCEHCEKWFDTAQDFRTHTKLHKGDNPYKCKKCSKYFSRHEKLRQHLRIHTGEKPFKCEHCNKCFKTAQHLRTHVKLHKGDKPYKCENCAKYFSKNEILKRHLRIHSENRPYKCEHCDKCFKTVECLKGHMKVHTGEKQFQCEKCAKFFLQDMTI